MKINDAGLALIKEFEGCKLKAYPDPGTGGAPLTIGYGHTGRDVYDGMIIDQEEADFLLAQDIATQEMTVSNFIKGVSVTENQFSALVSFSYNVGSWRASTLFNLVRANKLAEAADEFHKWDMSSGKVMPGLSRRRAAEKALYLTT